MLAQGADDTTLTPFCIRGKREGGKLPVLRGCTLSARYVECSMLHICNSAPQTRFVSDRLPHHLEPLPTGRVTVRNEVGVLVDQLRDIRALEDL